MMKRNKSDFLILKVLTLENEISNLKNKLSEIEYKLNNLELFRIFSPEEIMIKPLPSLENSDVKEFNLAMKKANSFDMLTLE